MSTNSFAEALVVPDFDAAAEFTSSERADNFLYRAITECKAEADVRYLWGSSRNCWMEWFITELAQRLDYSMLDFLGGQECHYKFGSSAVTLLRGEDLLEIRKELSELLEWIPANLEQLLIILDSDLSVEELDEYLRKTVASSMPNDYDDEGDFITYAYSMLLQLQRLLNHAVSQSMHCCYSLIMESENDAMVVSELGRPENRLARQASKSK